MLKAFYDSPMGQASAIFLSMIVAVLLVGWLFLPLLAPLIISAVLYTLLESNTTKLIQRGFTHTVAVSIILASLIGAFIGVGVLFIPVIFEQIGQFQHQLPVVINKLSMTMEIVIARLSESMGLATQITNLTDQWMDSMQSWGTTAVLSSAGFLVQFAVTLLLVPIITFFLLKDYRNVRNYFLGWVPNTNFELGWLMYYRVTRQLQRYVRGVVIQSGIMALVVSIGFTLIGLDMAILFGFLAGLLNVIPYVGPIIAAVLPTIVVVTSGTIDMWLIIGVVSVIFIAQVIDNAVVIPSVIASSIGLHPLIVLFGVIIVGSYFGILGMLLAVPLMATTKIIWHGLVYGLHGSNDERPLPDQKQPKAAYG